jgi:ATPase family associated with various cellular activities (AAA)
MSEDKKKSIENRNLIEDNSISNEKVETQNTEKSGEVESEILSQISSEIESTTSGQLVDENLPKNKSRKILAPRKLTPLGIALIGAGAALLVGLLALIPFIYQTFFTPVSQCRNLEKISATTIKDLELIGEKKQLDISESKEPRYKELIDYYREVNPDLFAYLDSLELNNDPSDQTFKVGYVMGSAGIGKTTITEQLENKYKSSICSIKLSKLFDQKEFFKKSKPDLVIGEKTYNLPTLQNLSDLKFDNIFKNGNCCDEVSCKPIVILDDLDEIHPELAQRVLEIVENEANNLALVPHPKNILIFGRPEGFSYWLKERRRHAPANLTSPLIIKTPEYKTYGDLKLLMEATDKRHNRTSSNKDTEVFFQTILSHKWLSYNVGNIMLANFVRESSTANPTYNDKDLMNRLFNNILDYDKESHDRPNMGDSIYLKALEQIAAKYADQAAKNDGYFEVNFEDTIRLYDDDCKFVGEVSVRNVLNNSGIVFLNPADFKTAKYNFQPFWIHPFLVQRWNERISKIL